MSYFLEDTKKIKNVPLTDYTGMNEAMLNAEIAWGSIKEEAMITEYAGIKNESTSLIEEAKDSFFDKVKNFFKKLWETIQRVVLNIKNKILKTIDVYGKFALSARKKVGTALTNKDVESYKKSDIDTITNKSENYFKDNFKKIDTISKKDKDTKSKFIDQLNKDYKDKLDKFNKLEKNTKITDINIKNMCDFLAASRKNIDMAIDGFKRSSDACKHGQEAANTQNKTGVEVAKFKATLYNTLSSREVNIRMKACSVVASYIKDVIKATN